MCDKDMKNKRHAKGKHDAGHFFIPTQMVAACVI